MKVLDLTHTIREGMLVYPGTEPPRLSAGNTIAEHGFKETALFLYSHTGTHMDSPGHMLEGAPELDGMDAERFCGKAAVIPCPGRITMAELEPYMDMVRQAEFLIFCTGQDALWEGEEYFDNFPVPDMEVIQYAIDSGKKGVGIDCMSVDSMSADPLKGGMANHMALFRAGMIIVENLCNLQEAAGKLVFFAALPLKFASSDGAPVRAVAILD